MYIILNYRLTSIVLMTNGAVNVEKQVRTVQYVISVTIPSKSI